MFFHFHENAVLFELLDSTIVNNKNSIKYTINKPPTTITLPVDGFLIDRKFGKIINYIQELKEKYI